MKKWFESEIERAKEDLKNERSTIFNGVDVKSNELRKELLQAHIKFCKSGLLCVSVGNGEIVTLNSQIDTLKAEVEEYKKSYVDAKNERDCQVTEISLEKDRLEETISQLDDALYTVFGIRHTDFKNHLELADALRAKATDSMSASNDFPTEPIKVADWLICAARIRENCMTGKEYEKLIYDKDDLRQIAEHLLVYCNHAESEE